MSPHRRFISRLALMLLLTVGVGVVWGFLVAWISTLARQIAGEPREHWNFTVSTTGTPYQTRYTTGGAVYRTLDGNAVPAEKTAEITSLEAARLGTPLGLEWPVFHLNWGERMILFGDPGPPGVLWYFVHNGEREAGGGYFVGYHAESKHRIGYLARSGFQPGVPPAGEWFPIDGRRMQDRTAFSALSQDSQSGIWRAYNRSGDGVFPFHVTHLIAEDKLWEIDFRERTARVVFAADDMLSFGLLERAIEAPPDGGKQYIARPNRYLAVRLCDRVIVVDPRSDRRRAYRIPEPLRHQTFTFYELQNKKAVITFMPHFDPETIMRLMVLSEDGTILNQAMTPRQPARWYDQPVTIASVVAFAMPEPVVAIFAAPAPYAERAFYRGEQPLVHAWLGGLKRTWPQILLVLLVSGGMAEWVRRRQKRLGQRHAVLWAVFVFLGGPPGLAGYLLHRSWPFVAPCPNCQRPAPRDRQSCMHCGESFLPPAPQGIEVFAA